MSRHRSPGRPQPLHDAPHTPDGPSGPDLGPSGHHPPPVRWTSTTVGSAVSAVLFTAVAALQAGGVAPHTAWAMAALAALFAVALGVADIIESRRRRRPR